MRSAKILTQAPPVCIAASAPRCSWADLLLAQSRSARRLTRFFKTGPECSPSVAESKPRSNERLPVGMRRRSEGSGTTIQKIGDPLANRDHVEKVQDPVLNALKADPEFVNPIAQKVGFGPPQFVTHFTQPLQTQEALVLDLCGQFAEPRQEWARSVLFLVKDNFRSRRSISVYSQTCESANGDTVSQAAMGAGFFPARGSGRLAKPPPARPAGSPQVHRGLR